MTGLDRADLRRGSGWPGSAGRRGYAVPGGAAPLGRGGPPAPAARSRVAARLHKHASQRGGGQLGRSRVKGHLRGLT